MSRKKVEDYITTWIDKILPGSDNTKLYKEKFSKMTDIQFREYVNNLKSGKVKLVIQVPPFQKVKLNLKRNLKLADELGVKIHQKLKFGPNGDDPAYTTPIEFMVLELPIRRTAQSVVKNISAPTDTKVVDMLTGQPTGSSKGAAVTYPELQLLSLNNTLLELMKYRGGDSGAYQALINNLVNYGSANADTVEPFSTGVTSKNTLKSYLAACHLKNNL